MEAESGRRAYGTPVGSSTGARRIAAREQHRQLMSSQALGAAFGGHRPPAEAAPRKPLVTKPKSLAIIGQYLQGRPSAIAEDEDRAQEGIVAELFLAEPRQAIDAPAKISRLDGHQDLHLRCDLQHQPAFQKVRVRASTSAVS